MMFPARSELIKDYQVRRMALNHLKSLLLREVLATNDRHLTTFLEKLLKEHITLCSNMHLAPHKDDFFRHFFLRLACSKAAEHTKRAVFKPYRASEKLCL